MGLRYLTAGESHGEALVGIIDGFVAGLVVDVDYINNQLKLRQGGMGRGSRMLIEQDKIEILAGVSDGVTTGNPIAFLIKNKDKNNSLPPITAYRPGHVDYAGSVKYGHVNARSVAERASARETAMRVAIGAICRQLLQRVGVNIVGHTTQIGEIKSGVSVYQSKNDIFETIKRAKIEDFFCIDTTCVKVMKETITAAQLSGDTIGGKVEVVARGMPIGVGSHIQFDTKLDYAISGSMFSIQAVKEVEIGNGGQAATTKGSNYHDPIVVNGKKIFRTSNNAGGIEAGISNGEDIVVGVTLKPIPSVTKGVDTVDFAAKIKTITNYERGDTCAIAAACVVAQNVLAYVLTEALIKFTGADTVSQMMERIKNK